MLIIISGHDNAPPLYPHPPTAPLFDTTEWTGARGEFKFLGKGGPGFKLVKNNPSISRDVNFYVYFKLQRSLIINICSLIKWDVLLWLHQAQSLSHPWCESDCAWCNSVFEFLGVVVAVRGWQAFMMGWVRGLGYRALSNQPGPQLTSTKEVVNSQDDTKLISFKFNDCAIFTNSRWIWIFNGRNKNCQTSPPPPPASFPVTVSIYMTIYCNFTNFNRSQNVPLF